MDESTDSVRYAGFWLRIGAAVIDSLALVLVMWPLLYLLHGAGGPEQVNAVDDTVDLLLNVVLPAVLVIVLWIRYQATPGKMLLGARVVDANSGAPASRGQYIVRYIGYYLATLPLALGLLWVAFDRRKQGWHDKLARTVVIRA